MKKNCISDLLNDRSKITLSNIGKSMFQNGIKKFPWSHGVELLCKRYESKYKQIKFIKKLEKRIAELSVICLLDRWCADSNPLATCMKSV